MTLLLVLALLIYSSERFDVEVVNDRAERTTSSIAVKQLAIDGVTLRQEAEEIVTAKEMVDVAIVNVRTDLPTINDPTSFTAEFRKLQTGRWITDTPGTHQCRIIAYGLVAGEMVLREKAFEVTVPDKAVAKKKPELLKKPVQESVQPAPTSEVRRGMPQASPSVRTIPISYNPVQRCLDGT